MSKIHSDYYRKRRNQLFKRFMQLHPLQRKGIKGLSIVNAIVDITYNLRPVAAPTGRRFNTVYDAAKKYDVPSSVIHTWCRRGGMIYID